MVAGGCSRCWLFVYLFIFFMIIFKLCLVGWLNAGVRCVWRTSTIKIETNSNLLRFDGAIYIPPYDVCVANQSCFFAGVFYWRPSIIFRFFFLELMFMTLWYNNNVRSTQYTHTHDDIDVWCRCLYVISYHRHAVVNHFLCIKSSIFSQKVFYPPSLGWFAHCSHTGLICLMYFEQSFFSFAMCWCWITAHSYTCDKIRMRKTIKTENIHIF